MRVRAQGKHSALSSTVQNIINIIQVVIESMVSSRSIKDTEDSKRKKNYD